MVVRESHTSENDAKKKTKDVIERLNLKKSIDFLKITPNIENMLSTFSVENFILNKRGHMHL